MSIPKITKFNGTPPQIGQSKDDFVKNNSNFVGFIPKFIAETNNSIEASNGLFSIIDNINTNVNEKNENVNTKSSNVDTKHNEIMSYTIPTEATYNHSDIDFKDNMINNANFTAYGYTKNIDKDKRFIENADGTVTDVVGDAIRFSDGLYEQDIGIITHQDAPFAPGSTDELLDYSINGVTTQSSHSSGDIVHVGNGQELVTGNNSTFADGVGDWAEVTLDNGVGKINTDAWAFLHIPVYGGSKYRVSIDWITANPNTRHIRIGDSSTDRNDDIVSDVQNDATSSSESYIVTAIGDSMNISILDYDNDVSIDNVSVKPIEQTYQATETTTSGELTTSSKFQKISSITRQDVIVHQVVNNKAVYKTIKGLHTFAPGTSNDDIASAYSWSKLGNGLYSIDGVESIIVGLSQRLNSGAYHPAFNNLGGGISILNSDGDHGYWYYANTDGYLLNSAYNTIKLHSNNSGSTGSISRGVSGRPDSRLYDKLYFDSINGLVFKPSYAIAQSQSDILAKKTKDLLGVDVMSEAVGVEYFYAEASQNAVSTSSGSFYISRNGMFPEYNINGYANELFGSILYNGIFYSDADIYIDNSNDKIGIVIHVPINSGDIGICLKIYKKDNTTLTQGTNLTLDVIGDPVNYPAPWLDHLALGKSLPFNPLLVGQDGASYISGTPNVTLFEKSSLSAITVVRGSSNSWGTTSVTMDTINNTQGVNLVDFDTNIVPYTSLNTPLVQAQPKPIELVSNQVIASNSHSWYKGGGIVNAVTGKISTGNGSKSLVAKGLEDALVIKYTTTDELDELSSRDIGYSIYCTGANTSGDVGYIYIVNTPGVYNPLHTTLTSTVYTKISSATPTHSTIDLDLEITPSAKAFTSLALDDNGEYLVQVNGQETISNGTDYGDSGNDFTQLTNGTKLDDNANTVRTFCGYTRTGMFKGDN